jgi:hypothetical protein
LFQVDADGWAGLVPPNRTHQPNQNITSQIGGLAMSDIRRLTLDEFLADTKAPELDIGARFNGGAFMDCHRSVYAETGIWIDELVPVFQRLDAHLAAASEKTVRELSPQYA